MPPMPIRPQFRLLLRRLGALLYDVLIVAGVIMVTSLVLIAGRNGEPIPPGASWFQGMVALQWLGYFAGFWTFGGQTPGLRTWRLRLVSADGGSVGPARTIRRLVAAVISVLPAGVGFAWMFVGNGQALHDRLSGTRMIEVANPG